MLRSCWKISSPGKSSPGVWARICSGVEDFSNRFLDLYSISRQEYYVGPSGSPFYPMLRAESGGGRMNDEPTQTELYQLTSHEGPSTSPIRECLRNALNEYFDRLNGHDPKDLYEIVMKEIEPPLLETTLKRTGGNQTKAAKYLGMNRSTLRKKLKQYGINDIT